MQKIGFIGPNKSACTREIRAFGIILGKTLASPDRVLICGGMGGFMEAVCKGAKESANTFAGQTIGILPGEDSSRANEWVDVTIPTGMGIARNIIIVRSADILIAAGGGAGTLSEIAFAWQLKKKVLCVTRFDGWAKELAGKNVDTRNKDLLIPVKEVDEIVDFVNRFYL
ncbi:MAG: TIGR00725 family protein [Bacteroidota bacterium]